MTTRGRHPIRRAAAHASRSYQPIERSMDPKSCISGLDLDHEDDALGGVEREHVDPASRPVAAYLDLPRNQPACALETARHVTHASNVGCVPLPTSIAEERRIHADDQASSHRLDEACGCTEGQVLGLAGLDHRNPRLRHIRPPRQLGLAPPDRASQVGHHGRDCQKGRTNSRPGSASMRHLTERIAPRDHRRLY